MTEPNWGLAIIEVIKYTVPALIVFITVYYLSKQFFQAQQEMALIKDRTQNRDKTMTIKLQAYERLMLYADRMDVVNMALRLNQKDISAQDLMQAMLISVQKEYEHNSAQQIYVSETLWQILSQAKTGTVNLIRAAHENCETEATSQDFLRQLQNKMQEVKLNPADQAKLALRSEAAAVLNL